jgi:hypothetical protein
MEQEPEQKTRHIRIRYIQLTKITISSNIPLPGAMERKTPVSSNPMGPCVHSHIPGTRQASMSSQPPPLIIRPFRNRRPQKSSLTCSLSEHLDSFSMPIMMVPMIRSI